MSNQKELCWINYALPFGRCYVRRPDGADDKRSDYSIDRDGNVYTYNPETDSSRLVPGATVRTTTGEPFRFNGALSTFEDIDPREPDGKELDGKEPEIEKTLWACIYRDTIPGWPFDEDGYPLMGDTNLCDVPIPERILREWFDSEIAPNDPELTFEKWFWEESTADDTDGLFTFAMDRGYYPDDIIL